MKIRRHMALFLLLVPLFVSTPSTDPIACVRTPDALGGDVYCVEGGDQSGRHGEPA